jgi:hypothetical protein
MVMKLALQPYQLDKLDREVVSFSLIKEIQTVVGRFNETLTASKRQLSF